MDFWDALPEDIQNFAVSTAAGIATRLVPGQKTDVRDALQEALAEGLACFLSHFGENCSYFKQDLQQDAEIQDWFASYVKDESFAVNKENLQNALYRIGIDTSTIEGFNLDEAILSFGKCFRKQAEGSQKLIQLLQLHTQEKIRHYGKESLETQKEILRSLNGKDGPTDLDDLRERYFRYLREQFRILGFRGLTDKAFSMPLNYIFIRPAITKELPGRENTGVTGTQGDDLTNVKEPRHSEEVGFPQIMKSEYAVIIGDPGAGKSTLLKYIALAFADGKENERLETEERWLPIIFPIAAYASELKKSTQPGYSLKDFIPDHFKSESLPDLSPLFTDASNKGQAIFLIDGLDEVRDEAERIEMVRHVRNFIINNYPGQNRYVITCRTASYTAATRFVPIEGNDFTTFRVLPFDTGRIDEFLLKWYRNYEKEVLKKKEHLEAAALRRKDRMMEAIKADSNILRIARNPLMLTILALIEHEGGELPKNRADLYGKCIEMLAGAWDKHRSLCQAGRADFMVGTEKIDDDFVIEYLGPVATRMLESSSPDIDYDELKEQLGKMFMKEMGIKMRQGRQYAKEFIEVMGSGSGILEEKSSSRYGFMHETFKEYLAARILSDHSTDPVRDLGNHLLDPKWREVVLLAAASMKPKDVTGFVQQITKQDSKEFRNLVLAGECLMDVPSNKLKRAVVEEFIAKAREIAGGDHASRIRAELAEILAWLGEMPKDLFAFIDIPEGRYQLSVGPFDITGVALSKYPVTNEWFRKFVEAEGYSKLEYWRREGRKWLIYTKALHPHFWHKKEWTCPSSPVVGVTWWEADAFCRFLTKTKDDGYIYRLPDEREWEAAAAGFEAREYPWGKWEEGKCNTLLSGIEKTSPVGLFPKGETPEGVAELAGNVWEWTTSDYFQKKALEDFPFGERAQRLFKWQPVLRGGSWYDNPQAARCAARGRTTPEDRTDIIGFRCARTKK